MASRDDIARSAADRLEAALAERSLRAVVGFDGFIDEIIHAVDRRRDMSPDGYTRFRTIADFAARLAGAAGKSTNIELVVKEERFGGNGPLMASALGRLGARVTYIGAVGEGGVHPLYAPLEQRCERVVPIAPPAHTDALEFEDGKVMLGKPANVQRVTWDRIKAAVGLGGLREALAGAGILGLVNWTMLSGMDGIFDGLREEVLPAIPIGERPAVFVDLCDPAKRSTGDLRAALERLTRLGELARVTLGLNLAEAEQVAGTAGVAFAPDRGQLGESIRAVAAALRERLRLSCVVVHPREGAGGATEEGEAWFDGPFTRDPRLSTGAGDHFNGGFALASAAGLPLAERLAVGCAVSGAYVRDAESPTRERLGEFLRALPDAEE